jgi:hypothetical protein
MSGICVKTPLNVNDDPDSKYLLLFSKVVKVCDADKHFSEVPISFLDEFEKDVFDRDRRIVDLTFSLNSMDMTVRTELADEYFCITTFAKFSDDENSASYGKRIIFGSGNEEFIYNYKKLTAFMHEYDSIMTQNIADAERRKKEFQLRSDCHNMHKYFHSTFWSQFLSRVQRDSIFCGRIFDSPFADFRGIILSNETCNNEIPSMRHFSKAAWAYEVDHKLRLLLEETHKYEMTVSNILNCRGVYMSTLGAHSQERSYPKRTPIEYVLYIQNVGHCEKEQCLRHDSNLFGIRSHFEVGKEKLLKKLKAVSQDRSFKYGQTIIGFEGGLPVRGVNEFELGRFVDRLHISGTVRLAAMKYYKALLDIGLALSSFDPAIQRARDVVAKEDAEEIKNAVNDAHAKFFEMTETFNKNTETRSGITYRIVRARYYINKFNKNIPGLHLSTLDGYQRYDNFIERHLGHAFEFIDSLGKRYERAMNHLSSLDQYHSSWQAVATGKNANNINISIREIQKYGEFILFLFPVPYYASSLVEDIFKENEAEVFVHIFWVASIWFAVWRLLKDEEDSISDGKVPNGIKQKKHVWRRKVLIFGSVRQLICATLVAIGMVAIGYVLDTCGVLKMSSDRASCKMHAFWVKPTETISENAASSSITYKHLDEESRGVFEQKDMPAILQFVNHMAKPKK